MVDEPLYVVIAVVALKHPYEHRPLARVHRTGHEAIAKQGGVALERGPAEVAARQGLPLMIRHLRVGNRAGGDLLYAGDTFLGFLLTLGYSAADFAGTWLWHILDSLRDIPCR